MTNGEWRNEFLTKSDVGATIQTRDLKKDFGEICVLRDINLDVEASSFVAIVGHSGCGKSTLLRLMAGLEKATSGVVLLDGQAFSGISPDVRMLFQEARLLPWKKVLDNVMLGIVSPDKSTTSLEALEAVGLKDRRDEWPSVLSGGQKQRVALARALACHPKLLLLDEPLGALDALTRIEMQQLIEDIWIKKGFTTVLVTHDVSEAVALADRVIFIDDHSIVMDVAITLPRPRERNSDFSYFEKRILDRVMHIAQSPESQLRNRSSTYVI
jgi:sulfonate transport system ATP-binding protein